MRLTKLRNPVQFLSFVFLTYGGYLGIKLGFNLPCFSCPYVHGCGGACYLMALQRSQWGFAMSFKEMFSIWGIRALGMFLGFVILIGLLYRIWCGWICPFGTLQDILSGIRKKLNIRESKISWKTRDKLRLIKYILLVILITVPLFMGNAGLHRDFNLLLCKLCPARIVMPFFEGNFKNMSLDMSNYITFFISLTALVLTGIFVVGVFFKDRFFCIFCPMLALMRILDKPGLIRLKKNVYACSGCGNCQRICPMDIRRVRDEMRNSDVVEDDCLMCFKCVDSCPEDAPVCF